MSETDTCGECGMGVDPGEYHPYAACLMFKHCRDSEIVRRNLAAVQQFYLPRAQTAEQALGEVVDAAVGHMNEMDFGSLTGERLSGKELARAVMTARKVLIASTMEPLR